MAVEVLTRLKTRVWKKETLVRPFFLQRIAYIQNHNPNQNKKTRKHDYYAREVTAFDTSERIEREKVRDMPLRNSVITF